MGYCEGRPLGLHIIFSIWRIHFVCVYSLLNSFALFIFLCFLIKENTINLLFRFLLISNPVDIALNKMYL